MAIDYDYVFKICFLGQGSVGKTSLILRYTQNSFIEAYKPTLGTDFAMKKINIDGARVALQVWDLAGQEHFKTLRSFYSRGASAGVIVFDVTQPETFMVVKEWYDQFKKDSSSTGDPRTGAPVFLVANKIDLESKRIVPNAAGQMIEKWLNVQYYELSAKEGKNVEKLFSDISARLIPQDV